MAADQPSPFAEPGHAHVDMMSPRSLRWTSPAAAWRRNKVHYLQEALGLGIFMISACFFSAMFEGDTRWHAAVPMPFLRLFITAILMGSTALFIFYSPVTSPSGSQINPAVTLAMLRLGMIAPWDAVFYIVFQILGGTLAVYLTGWILGPSLTDAPVNYAATVPGHGGAWPAFIIEFVISVVMMTMILFTVAHPAWKRYTRIFAATLVVLFVITAGPVSGFGMNPARSIASAIPSGVWTAFWIYAFVPVAGMLTAAEFFLWVKRSRREYA